MDAIVGIRQQVANIGKVIELATKEKAGYRVNDDIRGIGSCRLIDEDGEQLGIFGIEAAKERAYEADLDLVEIAPEAQPPVCRIMNYGKYQYEQQKKAKVAAKNASKTDTKEMKFRPRIDVGDYETKKRHIIKFLSAGNKVKVTIMFRGREMAHPDLGLNILSKLADDLSDVASVSAKPKMDGRNMIMVLAPLNKK